MTLLVKPLFGLDSLAITPQGITYTLLIVLLLVALLAYRFNHRKQAKASQYMDEECNVYNKKGLEMYLKKKGCKLKNPTIMCIEIKNLSYLYTTYTKRKQLMYDLSNAMLKGLSKLEVVGRIEFNKFGVIFDNRSREDVKLYCESLEEELDILPIEDYGRYNFYNYFGIYENSPVKDYKEVVYISSAIVKYSKVNEGNRYYYCPEVAVALEKIRRINLEKQSAFEQNKFVPYIQPKVELKTGNVIGGEILCRWVDEVQNFKYSPAEFIPIFENNGFIKKIDKLMLERACQLVQTLVNNGKRDIVISVNISKVLFMSENFETSIMEIVNKHNVSPTNLELEITETAVMENFAYVSNCIMTLRQLGFKVAMDDFGKEYSSLGSLSLNPFDVIKLDMVFFKNKLATEKDRIIVRNVLDMLSKLNCKKVCEGVSDKQTLDVIATINQDVIIQGYCISEPIPVSQFEAFLATKFEFNYPPLFEMPTKVKVNGNDIGAGINGTGGNGGTSININGMGDNSSAIDKMRLEMIEMERKFQEKLDEQRRLAQEEDMKRLKDEINKLKEQPKEASVQTNNNNAEIDALRREIDALKNNNNRDYRDDEIQRLRSEIDILRNSNNRDYRDDEIHRLRREIDDLRYNDRRDYQGRDRDYIYIDRSSHDDRKNDDYEKLQRQIEELKESQNNQQNNQQIDVNNLIEKLAQSQNENARYQVEKAQEEAQELRDKLEQERKEREELEFLLKGLNQNGASNDDDDDDDNDFDDDDDDKPIYSRNELESIIEELKEKYQEEWNVKAKEEMPDEFDKIIHDLKLYNKKRASFNERLENASPEVRQMHDAIRSEFLSYEKVSNRTLNSYDAFYIGRNQIAKMSLTKTKVRVFLALDPFKYSAKQFPHRDVSNKKVHTKTPFLMMIKSNLSFKRLTKLIADLMTENNCMEKVINANVNDDEFKTSLNLKRKDNN